MQHFSERVIPGARCDVGGCVSEVVHQTFLECEPSVLILKVCRAGSNEAGLDIKWNGLVVFPEELTGMRSDRYTPASVLLHRGDGAQDGHFVSICSWGSGMCVCVLCDDHQLRDLSWSDVAVQSTW